MDDLERAARKQRARDAAAADRALPEPADPLVEQQARLLRTSLAERSAWDFSPLLFVQFLVCFFAPAAVLLLLGNDSDVLFMLAGVGGLALFVVVLVITERVLAAQRQLSLLRLGHGFDGRAYLAQLAQQRHDTEVVIRLGFADPWPADQLATACDAVRSWTGFPVCHADGDRAMIMSSGSLETTDTTSARVGNARRFFTNRPAHDAFQRVRRKVLPRLHRRNPVTSIDVELRGEVTPF
ncbi:MAG TPA: hypothetical protein VL172_05175 [Kofleriaceae bacterium]|nr:hypothetical protein [Kofleriaceae bacterium]